MYKSLALALAITAGSVTAPAIMAQPNDGAGNHGTLLVTNDSDHAARVTVWHHHHRVGIYWSLAPGEAVHLALRDGSAVQADVWTHVNVGWHHGARVGEVGRFENGEWRVTVKSLWAGWNHWEGAGRWHHHGEGEGRWHHRYHHHSHAKASGETKKDAGAPAAAPAEAKK